MVAALAINSVVTAQSLSSSSSGEAAPMSSGDTDGIRVLPLMKALKKLDDAEEGPESKVQFLKDVEVVSVD